MPPKAPPKLLPTPKWSLIDIGINLTDGMYQGAYHGNDKHQCDIEDVIRRAGAVGVKGLIITGGTLQESESAIRMAYQYNNSVGKACGVKCFTTVGCHPTRCNEFAENPQQYRDGLVKLISEHRFHREKSPEGVVVAVGECGLDYDREQFCTRDVQMPHFIEQLKIAEETGLPLFLHNRNTGDDFANVMKEHRHRFSRAVVHSFDGPLDEMKALVGLDLHIGINGCSMKTEENLKVIRAIPLGKLLLETDGPWCDIRPTHASSKCLTTMTEGLLGRWKQVKKPEKWEEGCMVKGRNEPASMVAVLDVVHTLRQEEVAAMVDVAVDVEGLPEEMKGSHRLAAVIGKNTNDVFELF